MPEEASMTGQTSIVTGASRGIGFHTARALALKGAHVVVIGHHRGRGEEALEKIRGALADASSVHDGSAEFALVDLSTQDQIRQFAESFRAEHDRLDVLVNNAGGFFLNRRESADGIEMTLALNHLNYFMLTLLLLDLLKETGNRKEGMARIVNVSSEAHRGVQIHFDDIEFERRYRPMEAYGQSKLANILFTYQLYRKLEGERVATNALHPGFVNTGFGEDHWLAGPVMKVVHFLFAKSADEGAETPIYLASSLEVEGVSGKYFIGKERARSSPASYDQGTAERLWDVSEEMTGLHS